MAGVLDTGQKPQAGTYWPTNSLNNSSEIFKLVRGGNNRRIGRRIGERIGAGVGKHV